MAQEGVSRPEAKVSLQELSTLDFGSLWKGRQRTTEVECGVLAHILEPADRRRILEVGTGEGRLTPLVVSLSGQYVGVDAVPGFLGSLRSKGQLRHEDALMMANAYRLPFLPGTFTALVCVRVFNFFERADLALQEFWRVLAPGGSLVLGVQVRPSLASVVDDIRDSLRGVRREPLTFSRAPVVPLPMTVIPTWQPLRSELKRRLSEAGFTPAAEGHSGLEDYWPFNRLPARFFVGLSKMSEGIPIFPTVFVRAVKEGSSPPELAPWEASLACPRCRRALASSKAAEFGKMTCGSCGYTVQEIQGIPDARWGIDP